MVRRVGDKSTKDKKIFVKFETESLELAFYKLKQSDIKLYGQIDKARTMLKLNPWRGVFIKDYKTKTKYKRFWGYLNLWKYELSEGNRLIYTIKEDKVVIISIVIEWGSHKKYEDLIVFIPSWLPYLLI